MIQVSMPFKKCRFGRISKTAFQCLVIRYDQTVYQQFDHRVGKQCVIRQYFTDTVNGLIDRQTGVTFFLQDFQLFLDTAPIPAGRQGRIRQNESRRDNPKLLSRYRSPDVSSPPSPTRERWFSRYGIQEPKVFVYLRRGSHRRTWVTGVHLLSMAMAGGIPLI